MKLNSESQAMIAYAQATLQIFVIAGCAVGLTGCSIAGTHFVRPPFENFELGKTMRTQIAQSVGKPSRVFTVEPNGKVLTVYEYNFSAAVLVPVEGITAVGRIASFWFFDDTLVGYGYESSYLGDSTDFDESKVTLLTKGKSSREDVERLLGKPSGRGIYPLVANPQDILLLYYHIGITRTSRVVSKKAIITIGQDGIVSEINLEIK